MAEVTLHLGDCLEYMRTLPDSSVALAIADPPYGINTKSDGQGKLSPWADLCNAAYWYTAWIGECRRILEPTGALWAFLNWRSMVTYQKASMDLRWPIESMLVWDKQWIGPGGQRGLRPAYELVSLWAMPEFSIDDRGIPDIRQFQWSAYKPNGHPAEKPEPLIRWLIDISCRPGGLVLDPFCGSGTTGVAAMRLSHPFVGMELDDGFYAIAERRIREAQAQLALPEFA